MAPRTSVAPVLCAVLWAALSLSGHARTLPSEVDKLLALKVELEARGLSYLLDTWRCPEVGTCDPCGASAGANDNWGAWHYVACRVVPDREYRAAVRAAGVTESRGSRRYGLVTNVHLSDLAIEGTLDSMRDVLCPFTHLRELDIDGGRLKGPVPRWIGECFPRLLELDLSHNELSGSVPDDVWPLVPNIEQIKLEDNRLTGSITPVLATLPNLRVLWLDENDLSGTIPPEFSASNAFPRILSLNLEDNPKLCGAAPGELAVDWRWHLDNQAGQSRDWFGFCQKDACGVFVTGGTRVGGTCPKPWELESSDPSVSLNCGKRWDQCGGTVAVDLPEPATNGGDGGGGGTVIHVPFDGARCCRCGLACVEAPDPDASPGTAFYRCVPDPTVRNGDGNQMEVRTTTIPSEVIDEYRETNDAETECAAAWGQCGGTASYLGPTCCEGAAPCVPLNEYYARCDPTGCARSLRQCGGYDHDGPQCCAQGLECVVRTEGFHQCVAKRIVARNVRSGREKYARRAEDGKLVAEARGERCAREFGQCGGFASAINGFAGSCCGPLRCVRKNDWFSQCERCVGTYERCGGGDHAGGTCCAEATDECVEVDEYFSQCRPMTSDEGVVG